MASLSLASGAPLAAEQPQAAQLQADRVTGWLFGPWIDALLIANVGWPLLLLWQWGDGFSGRDGLNFWQVYFLTTPHRWITLALVFLDRERFGERRVIFLAIAGAAIAAVASVSIATGTLTCLLTIDYLWNAWHFASQHHGMYRIYNRRSERPLASGMAIEKWALRLFLLYVIVRVAGATWSNAALESKLRTIDWLALAVPAWLLVRDAVQPARCWPRTLYLGSVMALYVSLLAAVHISRPALVLSLATASAVFHATEYLALVTWSVHARQAAKPTRLGFLNYLAPRWSVAMGTFVLVLGCGGWLLAQGLMSGWLFLNVIVAFLHYAYDGLIWRARSRA
jgi:hypothetical protein